MVDTCGFILWWRNEGAKAIAVLSGVGGWSAHMSGFHFLFMYDNIKYCELQYSVMVYMSL